MTIQTYAPIDIVQSYETGFSFTVIQRIGNIIFAAGAIQGNIFPVNQTSSVAKLKLLKPIAQLNYVIPHSSGTTTCGINFRQDGEVRITPTNTAAYYNFSVVYFSDDL